MGDVTQDIFEFAVELRDDSYYVTVAGQITGYRNEVGPFHSEGEALRAAKDLDEMCTSADGISVPLGKAN